MHIKNISFDVFTTLRSAPAFSLYPALVVVLKSSEPSTTSLFLIYTNAINIQPRSSKLVSSSINTVTNNILMVTSGYNIVVGN